MLNANHFRLLKDDRSGYRTFERLRREAQKKARV